MTQPAQKVAPVVVRLSLIKTLTKSINSLKFDHYEFSQLDHLEEVYRIILEINETLLAAKQASPRGDIAPKNPPVKTTSDGAIKAAPEGGDQKKDLSFAVPTPVEGETVSPRTKPYTPRRDPGRAKSLDAPLDKHLKHRSKTVQDGTENPLKRDKQVKKDGDVPDHKRLDGIHTTDAHRKSAGKGVRRHPSGGLNSARVAPTQSSDGEKSLKKRSKTVQDSDKSPAITKEELQKPLPVASPEGKRRLPSRMSKSMAPLTQEALFKALRDEESAPMFVYRPLQPFTSSSLLSHD